jgi:hypothetical protein
MFPFRFELPEKYPLNASELGVSVESFMRAGKIIADWHDVERWDDPSRREIPAFSGAQEQELKRLIAEALDEIRG